MVHVILDKKTACKKCKKKFMGSGENVCGLLLCPDCFEDFCSKDLPKLEIIVRDCIMVKSVIEKKVKDMRNMTNDEIVRFFRYMENKDISESGLVISEAMRRIFKFLNSFNKSCKEFTNQPERLNERDTGDSVCDSLDTTNK